jgi:hypothetical protein
MYGYIQYITHWTLTLEAAVSSEMLVSTYRTARCQYPEHGNAENFKLVTEYKATQHVPEATPDNLLTFASYETSWLKASFGTEQKSPNYRTELTTTPKSNFAPTAIT